ncbi:MAG: potassium channel family protein [Cryptosporangiaceae bacterium]|nr:potassium channel family protein [Cryptosporangiaceae bacterium]
MTTQEDSAQGPAGDKPSGLSFDRIVFFSDAVFAIVITLLVLPLAGEVPASHPGGDLAREVYSLWPRALAFVVGFLVIARFWISHHRTWSHLRGYDTTLIGLNLGALLTVSFMPFPTALLGSRTDPGDQFPVVFFALSMGLTSLMFTATWLYAVWRLAPRGLVTGTERELREFTIRSVATTAVIAGSAGAALFGLVPALVCWLAVVPVVRLGVARLIR